MVRAQDPKARGMGEELVRGGWEGAGLESTGEGEGEGGGRYGVGVPGTAKPRRG